MPFQLRNFITLPCGSVAQECYKQVVTQICSSPPDIYVFKEGHINIGVKFRDIEHKKYGYKIKSVEVKINMRALEADTQAEHNSDPHLTFLQDWKKFQIHFKYKLYSPQFYLNKQRLQIQRQCQFQKLDRHDLDCPTQEQMQVKFKSYSSQLQHLNLRLSKEIQKYLSKKTSVKNYLHGNLNNSITSWLGNYNSIVELFLLRKNKQKSCSWQTGILSIQTFSGKRFSTKTPSNESSRNEMIIYFETISAESNKQSQLMEYVYKSAQLQQKNNHSTFYQYLLGNYPKGSLIKKADKLFKFNHNTSYPQFLVDIYENYQFI